MNKWIDEAIEIARRIESDGSTATDELRAHLEAYAAPVVQPLDENSIPSLSTVLAFLERLVSPEIYTGVCNVFEDAHQKAAQPERRPLTPEQVAVGCVEMGCDDGQGEEAGFSTGVRWAECAHNITKNKA